MGLYVGAFHSSVKSENLGLRCQLRRNFVLVSLGLIFRTIFSLKAKISLIQAENISSC